MIKKLCALALCAALLISLAGCGRAPAAETERTSPTPETSVPTAVPDAPPAVTESAAAPTVVVSPFTDAQAADMLNFNCRGCALLAENMYYACALRAEGGSSLASYEVIDGNLLRFTVLVEDCGAEYLHMLGGRLYYLASDGRPESVSPDGSGRRTELDRPCRSQQLRGDNFIYLLKDGTLITDAGDTLLEGCSYAYVGDSGIFYISAADGSLHFYDGAAKADVCLAGSVSTAPLVEGGTLYCADADGRPFSLDLSSGERRECAVAYAVSPDYFYDSTLGWAARVMFAGTEQQTYALSSLFSDAPEAAGKSIGSYRVCRGFDGELRTDEIFSSDGAAQGFALVLPYGFELLCEPK